MVIVPTYNERSNIISLIKEILELNDTISVLVVDDNSPDGTASAVRSHYGNNDRVRLQERRTDRGLGKSYLAGFKSLLHDSSCEAILMMDADFTHDPSELPFLISGLTKNQVVLGSRYARGAKIINWSLQRRLLSHWSNFYARTILGLPFRDVTNSLMCFHKDVLSIINLDTIRSEGYAFLVELKYRFALAQLDIGELPITLTERRGGQSKMTGKVIIESILMPWKLRFFS